MRCSGGNDPDSLFESDDEWTELFRAAGRGRRSSVDLENPGV